MRSDNGSFQRMLPPRWAVPAFIALVFAGLAGNFLRYEIFFNIQFIFGSIFAILALQLLGFGPGVLAAVLIGSSTWQLWNHPYAIIILSCEVLAVGWLNRRRQVGIVLADAIYWILVGMPLVVLFYHGFMGLSASTTTITSVKQAVNGIANALAARLIFMALYSRSREPLFSLKELVLNLLLLFVLVPSLTLLAIKSRDDLREADRAIVESLQHASTNATHNLDEWLEGHVVLIDYLAEMAATASPAEIQHSLDRIREMDSDFLHVALMDSDGTSLAFSPRIDDRGEPNIGRNFYDRPYLPLLKASLKPMLSEMFMGRAGPPRPLVTVLAPIVSRGEFAGYVSGALDLEGLRGSLAGELLGLGMGFALLDGNGRVIVTNHDDLKAMDPFRRADGEVTHLPGGVSRWVPANRMNVSISDRWKYSSYLKESTIGHRSAWRLVLDQSIAPVQKRLFDQYAALAVWVLALLLTAVVCAEIFSGRIVGSLERLKELTTGLPGKLSGGREIAWPSSSLVETDHLLANFRDMAASLSDRFREVREMNATLEKQVAERTGELRASEERLQLALRGANDGLWDWDLLTDTVYYSPRWKSMLGYAPDELENHLDTWKRLVHPDDRETALSAVQSLREGRSDKYEVEFRMRHKDGSVRHILSRAFLAGRGQGGTERLVGTHVDITERKRVEEQLQRSLMEKEVLLKEVHHRVKNNMQVICSLLNLQANGIADGAVRALLEESRDRVNSMALIHEKLYRSEDLAHVDFKAYLESLVQGIAGTYKRPEIAVSVAMGSIAIDVNTGIPCGLIVNELLSNSFKHAFPGGRAGAIKLGIDPDGRGGYVLTVADDGVGFPADLEFRTAASLGLQLVNVLAQQLRGTVELSRGEGTRVAVTFPGALENGGNGNG